MSEEVLNGFIRQSPPQELLRKGRISDFGPSSTNGYDWQYRRPDKVWEEVSTDRLLELLPALYLRKIIRQFTSV